MCQQISGEGAEEEATVGAGSGAGGPVTTLYPF